MGFGLTLPGVLERFGLKPELWLLARKKPADAGFLVVLRLLLRLRGTFAMNL